MYTSTASYEQISQVSIIISIILFHFLKKDEKYRIRKVGSFSDQQKRFGCFFQKQLAQDLFHFVFKNKKSDYSDFSPMAYNSVVPYYPEVGAQAEQ